MAVTKLIDEKKCIGCGKCVSDCVTHYLVMSEDETGKRKPTFNNRSRCIDCGHCNAICPQGAISGGDVVTDIENDELLRLMASKRSIRHYDMKREIEQSVLDKIILAGQSAPTEKNRKTVRILLIKEQLKDVYNAALDWLVEYVQQTGSINPLYAPTMEMNSNREDVLNGAEYLVAIVGSPSVLIDAAITAERMQLEASSLNIGSLYRGDMKLAINNSESLRELLGIKKNEECLVTFAMGHTPLRYCRPAMKQLKRVEYL